MLGGLGVLTIALRAGLIALGVWASRPRNPGRDAVWGLVPPETSPSPTSPWAVLAANAPWAVDPPRRASGSK